MIEPVSDSDENY